MNAFYIFKPDMVIDKEACNLFFYSLKKIIPNIRYNVYKIRSWNELSLELYDDENLSTQKKIQILSTILAYKELFNDCSALAFNFKLDNQDNLHKLYNLKKEIRKKYAYEKQKYYIKILDTKIFEEKRTLIDHDISKMKYEMVTSKENIDISYIKAYLNYIHFSDPNIDSIKRDNDIIKKYIIV